MKTIQIFTIILCITSTFVSAQYESKNTTIDIQKSKWVKVATKMPAEWYDTNEAKIVAENVLLSQKEIGGWEKNKQFQLPFSAEEKEHYSKGKSEIGGTFDNNATITEMRFLAKIYSHIPDVRYKTAFEKGLNYIFIAQYKNGGWPQYFPVKTPEEEYKLDKTEPYSGHITYNDGAMVNTMEFLREIFTNNKEFASLKISDTIKTKAKKAFDNGVQCILDTQIIENNKPTVWCAQHDEKTLAPANARAYELASLSGSESVGIVLLLMSLENPSKVVITAIKGAEEWFEKNQLKGIKLERQTDSNGAKDVIVVADSTAEPIWARFYELGTDKPYFSSRDGIKRYSIAEISYERRNGYGWYNYAPAEVLKKYPEWKKKVRRN